MRPIKFVEASLDPGIADMLVIAPSDVTSLRLGILALTNWFRSSSAINGALET